MNAPQDTALRLCALNDAEHARWDAFVMDHPQGTFFHLAAWQGLIARIFKHRTYYVFAERAGQIVAVLPLVEVKSCLFGHSLSSLPFAVYGGALGDADAVHLLELRAESLARDLGVSHIEYRNVNARHADWPTQDIYVMFRKALSADDDENMNAIPRKQRAMVRKGIKHGLIAQQDKNVDRFFAVYADNVKRHGTPAMPKKWFAALMETFGEACEVLTVCDAQGTPLSSVLSFYFRDEVLPYYAGDMVAARDVAANDFKYWELMRHAAARGARVFDYGRSKVGTGPYSFKKNWGFEPQALAYEYVLLRRDSIPQNNPMNPKYRAFIAMWQRLPLSVANTLGPYLVRNLG